MSYFWFQKSGGDDPWIEALSEHRERIIADKTPAFVTVLDAEEVPSQEWGREQYAALRYTGPLYFDFDGESLEQVIPHFQEFLTKLAGLDVNLTTIRLYATGGRGFHVEIPVELWCENPPRRGFPSLPYIFKDMAYEMAVPTLDLRVYTGRKGRMWRTPNVERQKDGQPTGLYKVTITLGEALAMTPELYLSLCSEPRDPHALGVPTVAFGLAAMFLKAKTKMAGAAKASDRSKKEAKELARFKGVWPPTVQRVLSGEGVAPGIGFQRIAMQLAITANAMGKSADDLVRDADGLCKSHQGDSTRFNSPRKRMDELRRMWDYTHDNPCYTYSNGGLLSVASVDGDTSDLSGSDSEGVGYVPDEDDEDDEGGNPGLPDNVADELSVADRQLLEGMLVARSGVYRRTPDGLRALSNAGFVKPKVLVDSDDGSNLGFEINLVVDGAGKGVKTVPSRAFTSRAELSRLLIGNGATFSGTDNQAGALNLILTRNARKGKRVIYVTRKEGLDLVQNPTVRDVVQKDVIWASPDEVLTHSDIAYRFQPIVSAGAVFNTDVHLARKLESTPDTVAWLRAVCAVNDPAVVAIMLGWFVSCFHKPFYQELHHQFPLLHPNGPAGSGKSMTSLLFARLFHNTSAPVMPGAGQGSTPFTFKAAWTGTASIPVIVDEYKPAELKADRVDFLKQHFRLLYNAAQGASGGMDRGAAGGTFRDVTHYTYSAPCAYLGESQEMQTALVQRSLPVVFVPHSTKRHEANYQIANGGVIHMPQLGHLLMRQSMAQTLELRKAALAPLIQDLRATLDHRVHDRQVYNLAVVVAGLQFLEETLRVAGFGDELTPDLQRLQGVLYEQQSEIQVAVSSEIAKVFDMMSLISRTEPEGSEFEMLEGREYVVGDGTMDMLMRESFVKYFAWCKRKGFQPLFASLDAFMTAAARFGATTDKFCVDSPLKSQGQGRVFRFSLEKLAEEGVEMFKAATTA